MCDASTVCTRVSEAIHDGSFMSEVLKKLHSIDLVKVTKPHLGALPRPVVCVCVSACARVSPVTMVTQALRLTNRLALALRSSNRKAINYKFKQVSVNSVVSTGLLVEA